MATKPKRKFHTWKFLKYLSVFIKTTKKRVNMRGFVSLVGRHFQTRFLFVLFYMGLSW